MLPNGSNVSVFNLQTCFKLFYPTLGLRVPVIIIDVTVFLNNGFAKAKSCSMSSLLILAVVLFRELHTCYYSSDPLKWVKKDEVWHSVLHQLVVAACLPDEW